MSPLSPLSVNSSGSLAIFAAIRRASSRMGQAGCTLGAALTCFNHTWATLARFHVTRETFLSCEQ
jgi:hypothetical protein